MADSVARVKILAQIEGLEGFDKLKGAFKGLQQAIGPTDQQLAKARQDVIAFGEAGKKTEQIIRGQIDALKALKAQTSAGGGLYSSLGNDIRRLESDLNDLSASYTNAITGVKTSLAQARNLANATKSPGLFGFQISDERKRLQDLKLLERDYLETLARIRRDETTFAQNQGRSSVISEAMARNPAMADVIRQRGERGTLPNTLAAKQNEIAELKDEINNILRGTQDLEGIVQQWRSLEQRLARQLANPNIPANLRMDPIAAQRNIAELQSEYSLRKEQMLDLETQLRTRLSTAEKEYQHLLEGTTQETVDLVRNMELRERVQQKLAQQAEQGATQLEWRQSMRREDGVMIAGGKSYSATAPLPDDGWFRNRMREISPLYQSIGSIGLSPITNDIERMGNSYQEVAKDIRAAKAASDGSINSLRAQRSAWEALRNTLGSNKAALREVDRELDQIDRKLEKRSRSGGGIGPKLQAAGAIASGAIFGGPEGFLGGLGGAVLGSIVPGLGTVGGAFAGAALGGTVSQLRQQTAGIANYVRDLNLAKTTLAQASAGQDEYNRLLESARRISSDYAVGLKETINGYAQVAVAARANGLTLKETENIYRGLVASGVAFGKSQEDLDAIVTATVQVLSKGKLSAEELQGQIGERLPGAVAKFAAATGRSLPQLAKDLEQGNVKIADFVKFAERQLKDYDEIAKIIGDSPEKAGARLQIALDTAAETYGGFFQQIGAGFQDNLAQIVSWFNANEETIKEWVTTWVNAGRDIVNVITAIANTLRPVVTGFANFVNRAYQFYQNSPQGMLANAAQGAIRNIFGVENQAPLKSSDIFPEFKPGAFGSGAGATPSGAASGKTDNELAKAARERRKAENDLFQKQLSLIEAKLNLLREEGRLTEANSITEFEKARVAIELADSELALKQKQLALQKQFGKIESAEFVLQARALQAQSDQARAAYQKAIKEIDDKLNDIDNKFFAPGGTLSKEELSPFLQRVKDIRSEIDDAIESAKSLGGPRGSALAGRLNAMTGADIEGIAIRPTVKSLQDQIYELQNVGREITTLETLQRELGQGWYDMNEPLRMQLELLARQVDLLKEANRFRQDTNIGMGLREGAQQYVESIGTMREATAQLAQNGIKGVEDAIFSLVTTGTANFKEFAADMLKQTARMIIQQLVLRTLLQAIGAIGGGGSGAGGTLANFNAASAAYVNANGNVFANGIKPFAAGGIVTRPTLFKFANGGSLSTGLMGEAGPEAIVPLKRGADGKLGIAGGGGSTSVTVNVDASGSQVQGDSGKGEELGRAISTAVQAELIKQKRPGGLLAA
jgi:tape measure domain-containing protein